MGVEVGSYFADVSRVREGSDRSLRASCLSFSAFVAASFSFSLSEPESAGVGGARGAVMPRGGKVGVPFSCAASPMLGSLDLESPPPADNALLRLAMLFNL